MRNRQPAREQSLRAGLAWFVATAAALGLGADAPRIERLRVPAGQVGTAFPPGAEIVGVSGAELAELSRAAEVAAGSARPAPAPRILRAEHHARWEGDLLSGRSTLVARGDADRVTILDLAPWTPVVLGSAPDRVTADDQGHPWLRLEPGGAREITVEWAIRGRPVADGFALDLGLGRADVASWSLDLPGDCLPRVDQGIRREPREDSSGRRLWRLDGSTGDQPLAVRIVRDQPRDASRVEFWITGREEIQVDETQVAFRATWIVDRARFAPETMTVVPSAGLQLLDVSGEEVAGFRPLADGGTEIRFAGAGRGPATIELRGTTRPPTVGVWPMPTIRPGEGLWTGGRTVVRLTGQARRLLTIRPRDGSMAAGGDPARQDPDEAGETFVLDSSGSGPVADLHFAAPATSAVASTRGRLNIEPGEARIEAEVTWRISEGRPASLAVEVAAGWTIEDVRQTGSDESVAWHAEQDPDGAARLRIGVPATADLTRPLTFRVQGRWDASTTAARIDLPRIRPTECRVGDELWVAAPAPGLTVLAGDHEGLIWFDPALEGFNATTSEASSLAWRWLARPARGSVVVRPIGPAGNDQVRQRIIAREDRIELECRIRVLPGTEPLAITLDEPVEVVQPWRVPSGPSARIQLSSAAGAAPVWIVDRPVGVPITLEGRFTAPFSSGGAIPLIRLEGAPGASGTLQLETDPAVYPRTAVDDLRPLPEIPTPPPAGQGVASIEPGASAGLAWSYEPSRREGRLRVELDRLAPSDASGLIPAALLATGETPARPWRRRLSVSVVAGLEPALLVRLPTRARPLALSVAGRAEALEMRGSSLVVPLPRPPVTAGAVTVQLDYLDPDGGADGDWPVFSLPVLHRSRYRLVADGTRPALGLFGDRVPAAEQRLRLEALQGWVSRLPRSSTDELTLGDALRLLDAGPIPVVVDREGLALAGLGPASRVPYQGRDGASVASWEARLASIGLTTRAVDGMLLVGAGRGVAAVDAEALRGALRQATDPSLRYATVLEWSHRPFRQVPADPAERSAGVPVPTGAARLVRESETGAPLARLALSRGPAGWAVGIASLGLAIALGRRTAGRLAVILLTLAGGVCAVHWNAPAIALGLGGGSLAAGAVWAGTSLRRQARERTDRQRESSRSGSRRSGSAKDIAATGLAVLAMSRTHGLGDEPPAEPAPAILAVSAEDAPDRWYLLRADFDRLRELANPAAEAPETGRLLAARVEHEVVIDGTEIPSFSSRIELLHDRDQPDAWSINITGEREIAATLDDQPIAVEVMPGGGNARVWVEGKGPHHLVLKRVRDVGDPSGSHRHRLPLCPAPNAALRVRRLDGPAPVNVEGSRGPIERGESAVATTLGPVESVVLDWALSGREPTPPPSPTLDTLVLWDALSAGDRVIVRFVPHAPWPVETLRVVHDRDLILRSVRRAEEEATRTEPGSPESVLILRIAQGVESTSPIELEFWRPRRPDGPTTGRDWPRLRALDVTAAPTLVGLRRPGGWSGRLTEQPGTELVSDEVFARAWGEFPDASATLAGAIRYKVEPRGAVPIGPAPSRAELRTRSNLTLQAGRARLAVEADIRPIEGHLETVTIQPPAGWQTLLLEGSAVREWVEEEGGRLRVRLSDQHPASPMIRLEGWVPVPELSAENSSRVPVPWLVWEGLQLGTAELAVTAPPGSSLAWESLDGVAPAPGATEVETGNPGQGITRFTDPGRSPGVLLVRFSRFATRTSLRSELTVASGGSRLDAVLRYRPSGRIGEPFTFSLPSAWADGAEVWMSGANLPIERSERGEETLWSVQPRPCVLGTVELRVRARLAATARRTWEFPSLVPRGPGELVSRELVLRDASGLGLAVEGQGVEETQPPAAPRDGQSELVRFPTRQFRVTGSPWRLIIRPLEDAPEAQVALADLRVAIRADGKVAGSGRYQLSGPHRSFVRFRLGEGGEPLSAAVDGRSVPIHRLPDGTAIVALGNRPMPCLDLAWTRKATGTADGSIDPVLPILALPTQRTILDLRTPPGTIPVAAGTAWQPVPAGTEETMRLEAFAERVGVRAAGAEGREAAGRSRLLGRLIDFESRARAAERLALQQSEPGVRESLRTRIGRARHDVRQALHRAGLADLGRAAQARATGVGQDPLPDLRAEPPPSEALLNHGEGVARLYAHTGPDEPTPRTWTLARRPAAEPERSELPNGLPWFVGTLGLVTLLWPVRPGGSAMRPMLALGLLIGAAAAVLGPVGIAGPLIAAWVGWASAG